MFKEIPIEEQLDWGTDSAGDDQSDLDNEIVESAGLDTGMYHTSHLYDDNYTDGPCYDHYKPDRQVVSPSFLESNTNVSQQSLLWLVMSSLESKIDLINHHFASCSKCKGNADDTCNFLVDSGASLNFTNNLNDFSEYNEMKDGPSVQTASKDNQLQVCGMGAVCYDRTPPLYFFSPLPPILADS